MKQYMEICYTYEGNDSFFPLIAIVEVETKSCELIKYLADKALDKIKEKYPEKTIYMIDYKYIGNTIEIIK